VAVSYTITLDNAGMRALVASPWAQDQVETKAAEVADRARTRAPKVEGTPGEVELPIAVIKAHGKARARALVVIDHPSGMAVEAKHRVLGGALG
jgi:hypothetical protein